MFASLPAVLLSHVCSYLSPKQLLVTLAHAAKTTRALLTPACFSSHPLVLDTYELSVLSTFGPPSSLTLQPFHTHVLSDCCLSIELNLDDHISMQQVLNSLDYFPACKSLSVAAEVTAYHSEVQGLTDNELHALLHLPAALSCQEFNLTGFTRSRSKDAYSDGAQLQQGDRRVARAKRKRSSDSTDQDRTRKFEWKNIRLPSVTRIRLTCSGYALYKGGAAFVTAHTALVQLEVSTQVVSCADLTAIFKDRTALPHLTHFSLHEHAPWRRKKTCNLVALITSLAKSVVRPTRRPRPIEVLRLNIVATSDVLSAITLMQGLTHLHVKRAMPGWLEEWTKTEKRLLALPLLQDCILSADETRVRRGAREGERFLPASRGIQSFFHMMSNRPLQRLSILTDEPIIFDAAAMAQLARCTQLRRLELDLCRGVDDRTAWMDWKDVALFSSFAIRCLSCLTVVKLQHIKLTAESVAAVASAARELHEFHVSDCELSCHPAVVCAIIGGYCEDIEDLHVDDTCCHMWKRVGAADLVEAYQTAMATAGQDDRYKPFVQLCHLRVRMCWCTPASVWHALLSSLRWAARLHHVEQLWSDDPLAICALGYLPSLSALSAQCLLPSSFGAFMQRTCKQTGRLRFVACRELVGWSGNKSCREWPVFELAESVDPSSERHMLPMHERRARGAMLPPVLLRPRSDLFPAFELSHRAHHKAVLARWARGSYRADDERLNAATDEQQPDEQNAATLVNHRDSVQQHTFNVWSRVREEVGADEADEMSDVEGEAGESDEEKDV